MQRSDLSVFSSAIGERVISLPIKHTPADRIRDRRGVLRHKRWHLLDAIRAPNVLVRRCRDPERRNAPQRLGTTAARRVRARSAARRAIGLHLREPPLALHALLNRAIWARWGGSRVPGIIQRSISRSKTLSVPIAAVKQRRISSRIARDAIAVGEIAFALPGREKTDSNSEAFPLAAPDLVCHPHAAREPRHPWIRLPGVNVLSLVGVASV